MPYLSIIVPVYKVEQYICKCVDSILNQSYSNYELILVDDGSPDKCPEICDKYADTDHRIKVIHKENGGLTSAWMKGLESISDGVEYITFIDSDDYISDDYLEQFISKATEYNVDVVIGNTVKFYQDEKRPSITHKNGYYDKERLEKEVYPNILFNGNFHGRGYQVSRWGKLYRKEIVENNVRYCSDKTSYAEDLNLTFPIMLDAKSVYFLDQNEGVYFYRMNPNSILHAYDKSMLVSISHVYPSLIAICKEKKHDDLEHQVIADFIAASVQYFKNELQNPEGLSKTKYNIEKYSHDEMLRRAIKEVNWKKFRRLNVIIIKSLRNYNWFYKNIVTVGLRIIKTSGIRKPS